MFSPIILSYNNLYFIESQFSNITLKINGIGDKYILTPVTNNFGKDNYPNLIYINEESQSKIENQYYFKQTNNIVQLIWYNNIYNCLSMFYQCSDITEIDLSNFDTSKVINMCDMFRGCSSLSSLNLSNLDTSKVTDMAGMFRECPSLSSLNISNFNTSKVTTISYMFENCYNLKYINLKNFIENNQLDVNDMFKGLPNNVVIYLNEKSIKIKGQISSTYIIDCSECGNIKEKKIVNKTGICYNNNEDILYKYEYEGKYFENCLNGYLINESPIIKCKCDEKECYSCNNLSNYYEIENDNKTDGYIKCYKNPTGYYLDIDDYKYKKCFYTCRECEIPGNNITHNCLICKDNHTSILNNSIYFNCFINKIIESSTIQSINGITPSILIGIEKNITNTYTDQQCEYYYYYDDENNYICTLNLSCPDKYPKLLIDKRKCIKGNEIKYILEDIIKIENETKSKEKEIEYYNTILKIIEEGFTSENYDTTDLDNGKDEIIEMKKMNITLTTSENQKNNINMTSINLGECKKLLRNVYHLTNNETLYMKKLDIKQEGMKIQKIDYDI